MKRGFSIIVAATEAGGIGNAGGLPWKLPGDMRFFKKVTSAVAQPGKRNAVVMGRKTWLSIPQKFRPLAGRINVVLSRDAEFRAEEDAKGDASVMTAGGFDEALDALASDATKLDLETVFVIGGGTVYEQALQSAKHACDSVLMTRVYSDFVCDTHFPALDKDVFQITDLSAPKTDNEVSYQFMTYTNKNSGGKAALATAAAATTTTTTTAAAGAADGETKGEDVSAAATAATAAAGGAGGVETKGAVAGAEEAAAVDPSHPEYQYLELIREILSTGVERGDRTGTGTLAVFGRSMRFDLRGGVLPLLTTKRVFWRGVAEELLWFVSGSTNAKELQDKNVKIWDGNGSREYLDSIGLPDREEMDLGPVYGFQWRHFGADYTNMHADYTGQGYDQLAKVIEAIKTKPTDRRIILSAWNPGAFEGPNKMALPPCHMFAQFFVANGELSCQMYQRSADMGLGVPFNIASYSLLTHMLAHVCGLVPGEFIHIIGDTHVYKDHVEPLQEQVRNVQ